MKSLSIVLLSFLIVGLTYSQEATNGIKTLTQEQYEKYFPIDIQDARVYPSNDIVYIMPTNEKDKELQKKVIEYYRRTFIEGALDVPGRSRIITDTEALKEDLANSNIRTFGTAKGNLWTARFLEKAKDFPIKIYDDSIVADQVYRGNNYVLTAVWYNPDNYKYRVVLIVPQQLEYARYPWGRELARFCVFQNEKDVTKCRAYKLENNHWVFPVEQKGISHRKDTVMEQRIQQAQVKNDHFELIEKMPLLYRYPTLQQLSTCLVTEKEIPVDTLAICDINKDFSNIKDMSWLKPIAREYKIVAIGESHHLKNKNLIARRILFALNTYDYFPTLVMELPYSYAGYLNHYLSIKDDREAAAFYDSVLVKMTTSFTYKSIRDWNKQHPNKRLQIACSDVEHNYALTIKFILNPYFKKINPDANLTFSKSDTLKAYFKIADELLKKAKEHNLVGDYPFQTPQYMDGVLENVKSLIYFKTHMKNPSDHSERFKFMIRNVTDDRFLGKQVSQGKSVFWGGSEHFKIFSDSIFDGNAVKTEGYYLAHYFQPTKDKIYTVLLNTKAVSIEDTIRHVDPRLGFTIEPHLISLYKQGKIGLKEPVLDFFITEVDEYFYKLSYKYSASAFRVKSINWESAFNLYDNPYQRYFFRESLKGLSAFNAYILIPYSAIGED